METMQTALAMHVLASRHIQMLPCENLTIPYVFGRELVKSHACHQRNLAIRLGRAAVGSFPESISEVY